MEMVVRERAVTATFIFEEICEEKVHKIWNRASRKSKMFSFMVTAPGATIKNNSDASS